MPVPSSSRRSCDSDLFTNIREFFTRCSRLAPLLILVDDVQWADEPRLHLTQHLAQHVAALAHPRHRVIPRGGQHDRLPKALSRASSIAHAAGRAGRSIRRRSRQRSTSSSVRGGPGNIAQAIRRKRRAEHACSARQRGPSGEGRQDVPPADRRQPDSSGSCFVT